MHHSVVYLANTPALTGVLFHSQNCHNRVKQPVDEKRGILLDEFGGNIYNACRPWLGQDKEVRKYYRDAIYR